MIQPGMRLRVMPSGFTHLLCGDRSYPEAAPCPARSRSSGAAGWFHWVVRGCCRSPQRFQTQSCVFWIFWTLCARGWHGFPGMDASTKQWCVLIWVLSEICQETGKKWVLELKKTISALCFVKIALVMRQSWLPGKVWVPSPIPRLHSWGKRWLLLFLSLTCSSRRFLQFFYRSTCLTRNTNHGF